MIVNIQRIEFHRYYFGASDAQGIKLVCKALTFPNPSPFAYSDTISKFDKSKLTFDVGMITNVLALCKENGVVPNIEDWTYDELPIEEVDKRVQGDYDHQLQAIQAFWRRRIGILKVPTRGGKTFIASEIFRQYLNRHDGKICFIVDNVTLFTQAINDIKHFFEPYGGIEVGEIRGNRMDFHCRICVATAQTLQTRVKRGESKVKREIRKYLRDLEFLAVDEVHDNSSDSRLSLFKMCKNLSYQLCLSATPYRSGAFLQNLKLQGWSGDVVYQIEESVLKERGVLSNYKIGVLYADWHDIKPKTNEYMSICEAVLYDNDRRDDQIRSICAMLERLGLKTLLLFQSIEHGNKFARSTGYDFLSGETSGRVRESVKEAFLCAQGGILCASGIFKKGVTLPEVQVLINVDGGLEDANTIQKKGRVLGTTATKKKSLIIDIADNYKDYLFDHAQTRYENYTSVLSEEDIDCFDLFDDLDYLEEWVRDWMLK